MASLPMGFGALKPQVQRPMGQPMGQMQPGGSFDPQRQQALQELQQLQRNPLTSGFFNQQQPPMQPGGDPSNRAYQEFMQSQQMQAQQMQQGFGALGGVFGQQPMGGGMLSTLDPNGVMSGAPRPPAGGYGQQPMGQPGGNLLGGALGGGGQQPVLEHPGGNLVGRPPANPYTQQIRQEDPRMQAMRNIQMMNLRG